LILIRLYMCADLDLEEFLDIVPEWPELTW